jgi:DNA mismatch endonuclease (patch repair protein)
MTRRTPSTTPDVSARMKTVRTSRTNPERIVEGILRRRRLRFGRNVGPLSGRPDFVLVDHDVAIFVDGCFWHGCPRCFTGTKRNRAWWTRKIRDNRLRDARNNAALRRSGYRVLRLREHDSDARMERRISTMLNRG